MYGISYNLGVTGIYENELFEETYDFKGASEDDTCDNSQNYRDDCEGSIDRTIKITKALIELSEVFRNS